MKETNKEELINRRINKRRTDAQAHKTKGTQDVTAEGENILYTRASRMK